MPKTSAPEKLVREVRVLIADDEVHISARLIEFLQENGIAASLARNGTEVRKQLVEWKPDFVLYDLMLPDWNALTFLRYLKSPDYTGSSKMRVFVLSGHNNSQNVKECLKLGAADYLVRPVPARDLLARLAMHLQARTEVPDFQANPSKDEGSGAYYMHLTDLVLREALRGGSGAERLFNLSGLLSVSMKAVRVSVIRGEFEARQGYVMASSDKRDIGGLEIDLMKYPEVLYVLRHDTVMAIDNLSDDPTMRFTAELKKSIHFNSMIVCPIRVEGSMWGVLSIRMPESKEQVTDLEIRYAQLVAHVAGLIIQADPALRGALFPAPALKIA